jgi:hypothetical protein
MPVYTVSQKNIHTIWMLISLLSVSYRKICSVMHQLHSRKVSEKHLLIMVNCFSLKRSIFNKKQLYFYIFDVIMLFYISLPSWSNIKLCTVVDRERFSVFRVDHRVQKSGHPCSTIYQIMRNLVLRLMLRRGSGLFVKDAMREHNSFDS